MTRLQRLVAPGIVIAAALLVGAPLWTGHILAGHDAFAYYMYAQQTAANLRDGIVLPNWAVDLNRGFGGAGLLLYPPLTSTVHALPGWLGLPLVPAIGWLAVLAHAASGLVALLWLRDRGAGMLALPASLIYMLAPYRLLDLYERAALAEHWVFIWPPLILWAAATTRLRPAGRACVIAGASAALLLTNLPQALLLGLTLAAWIAVRAATWRGRTGLVGGATLAIGLASLALVPQALASRWVRTEIEYGPQATGFRCSSNTLFNPLAVDPAFNVTASWVVLTTAALAVLAYCLVAKGDRRKREPVFWLAAAVVWALLDTHMAGSLWDVTPVLNHVQFPWRAAAPMTLALAALASFAGKPRHAWFALGAITLTASPLYGRSLAPATILAQQPRSASVLAFPDPAALREAGALVPDPRISNPYLTDVSFPLRTQNDALFAEIRLAGSPFLASLRNRPAILRPGDGGTIEILSWGRSERRLRVRSPVDATLVWHSMPFPGMTVTVDGTSVATHTDDATSLLAHLVRAGTHDVEWRWRASGALRSGRWLSLAALTLWLVVGVVAIRERRRS